MDKNFLLEGKECINFNDSEGLKKLTESIEKYINDSGIIINFQNIYQKLLLYSCIKHAKDCIKFLLDLYFEKFDVVTKIALRQCFFYGKYLMKDKELKKWYDSSVIPLIKAK